jgi:hypothetical protein
MNENNHVTHAGPLEILAEWEGPALHEPGVLFQQQQRDRLPPDADAASLAAWIAVTALSGATGNSVDEAIKKNVLGVLSGWRHRFGQQKIDEVKQQLFLKMQQCRKHPRISTEELRERIDSLFEDIQG